VYPLLLYPLEVNNWINHLVSYTNEVRVAQVLQLRHGQAAVYAFIPCLLEPDSVGRTSDYRCLAVWPTGRLAVLLPNHAVLHPNKIFEEPGIG
jgi:hypothetical protein